jgi:modification methylase
MQQTKPKPTFKILEGDAKLQLQFVKTESIDTVFTSPEPPTNYLELEEIEQIIGQCFRVLKLTGSIWVNMSDYHNADGVLAVIPERFVYDMVVVCGFNLRNTIIWNRNAKTFDFEDTRRFRRDHEYLYWFVKDVKKHYFSPELPWTIPDVITSTYQPARSGVFESGFPTDLIARTALYTTPPTGRILDPFCGTGTTGKVALESGREFLGIEANPALIPKIKERLSNL